MKIATQRSDFELSEFTAPPFELYDHPRWYACLTRARAEKKVDRLLSGRGIESYVPLVERTRQWSDREKRVPFPLFPGYVFVRFPLRGHFEILRTPGLVNVVRVNGYPTPVRDSELESIRTLVNGANLAKVEPSACDMLVCGQEVRVVEGPLQGLIGLLLETRGKARVVVQIRAIRQAVSVEIDRRLVRALEEPSDAPLVTTTSGIV